MSSVYSVVESVRFTPNASYTSRMTPLATQVQAVFDEVDRGTSAFASASGIACPPGCGACCHSPNVEASELEMLPMAEHLMETGEAETVYQLLSQQPGEKICVFFKPVPGSSTDGRCSRYTHRPLVCRLFGFAGRHNKEGRPQFNACKVHQQAIPHEVRDAIDRVDRGTLRPPLFSEAMDAVWAIHPTLGFDRFPINEALRKALERVLFSRHYEERRQP